MKLVPVALVALSLLVGCSDGEKMKFGMNTGAVDLGRTGSLYR
jgi:major membrane immunogen (membrane-anchored lipoprotein)